MFRVGVMLWFLGWYLGLFLGLCLGVCLGLCLGLWSRFQYGINAFCIPVNDCVQASPFSLSHLPDPCHSS